MALQFDSEGVGDGFHMVTLSRKSSAQQLIVKIIFLCIPVDTVFIHQLGFSALLFYWKLISGSVFSSSALLLSRHGEKKARKRPPLLLKSVVFVPLLWLSRQFYTLLSFAVPLPHHSSALTLPVGPPFVPMMWGCHSWKRRRRRRWTTRRGAYFSRGFALQMGFKKNKNKSIKLELHLGSSAVRITLKTNFYEYKIGLYAKHPHWLLH